jgi:oligoribonuclease NrnB/cAMP/cGMP phosphodiesterase (DHH superfamily)
MSEKKENEKVLVITHGGCPDGTAAGFVMSLKYPDAVVYGAQIRNFAEDKKLQEIFLGFRKLFIVDYSYPKDVILDFCSHYDSVTIYDHHVTAQKDLVFDEPPANLKVVFDMNRCGTEICWDEEFGLEPQEQKNPTGPEGPKERRWWIKHISDRDLWKWEDKNSHAFSEAFSVMGINSTTLRIINEYTPDEIAEMYALGHSVRQYREKLYTKICESAFITQFEGYTVYAINIDIYQSDIGNILASRPGIDFAVIYRQDPTSTQRWYISLRGTKKEINLADLAKRLGQRSGTSGGGHPLAAGYEFVGSTFL